MPSFLATAARPSGTSLCPWRQLRESRAEQGATTHAPRHTAADSWLDNGATLTNEIQELLGHAAADLAAPERRVSRSTVWWRSHGAVGAADWEVLGSDARRGIPT